MIDFLSIEVENNDLLPIWHYCKPAYRKGVWKKKRLRLLL